MDGSLTPHIPQGRRRLGMLVRETGDVITVEKAAQILRLDPIATAKMLARWTSQGWLRRVSQGRYVAAPIEAVDRDYVLEDPWVLVPALYSPGYIGGRTAASHWDLTEQIFNDIVVFTTRSLREKAERRHGTTFTLKHIESNRLFGTRTVWRGRSKVAVSDIHRTIIDMLDDPSVGGGIQHVADCLEQYLRRPERNDEHLISYAQRLGNGAVFKRLGFLIEENSSAEQLRLACRAHMTKGYSKLDPALEKGHLASRWNLWVPAFWKPSMRT